MRLPQTPLDSCHYGLPWLCILVHGRGRKLGLLRAWFYAYRLTAMYPPHCRTRPFRIEFSIVGIQVLVIESS